jgi:hypothetical protein
MSTLVKNLRPGTLVVALEIPAWVAAVKPGTRGVVFEPANSYGDGGGPMVEWATGHVCNVYDGYCEEAP